MDELIKVVVDIFEEPPGIACFVETFAYQLVESSDRAKFRQKTGLLNSSIIEIS